MKELIESLTIFSKYKDEKWPTHCEHDVMLIVGIGEVEVSESDRALLEKLGWIWMDDYDCWGSFRYGSA